MSDESKNEPSMFFVEYRFAPTETLRQSEANELLAFILSKMVAPDMETEKPYELKELDTSLQTLVKVMMDLGIVVKDTEEFKSLSNGLKRQFMVYHRQGHGRYNPRTMGEL